MKTYNPSNHTTKSIKTLKSDPEMSAIKAAKKNYIIRKIIHHIHLKKAP